MDWYPWFPTDFRRDTYSLSLAEDGAYRRLIDEYMIGRAPLPDDDRALARILGVGISEWIAIAATVRVFFQSKDGALHHKRCDRELRAQNLRMDRNSARGQKAAVARWSKNNKMHTKRMLAHATLQDKDTSTSSSFPTAEEKKGLPISGELEAIMNRKLTARG